MTMKDADPSKITAAKDPSTKPLTDTTTKPAGTGQKKEVAGMIT